MSLMEQIKSQQVQARLSRHASASLLTTLLGEAAIVGKNAGRETTDDEVVAVVKKFIKNLDETIAALSSRNQDATAFLAELGVLEQFLPQQLSEYELTAIAVGRSDMKDFMQYLKQTRSGQYDGRLAAQVAKKVYG